MRAYIRIKWIFNFRSKLRRDKKLELICYFRFFRQHGKTHAWNSPICTDMRSLMCIGTAVIFGSFSPCGMICRKVDTNRRISEMRWTFFVGNNCGDISCEWTFCSTKNARRGYRFGDKKKYRSIEGGFEEEVPKGVSPTRYPGGVKKFSKMLWTLGH